MVVWLVQDLVGGHRAWHGFDYFSSQYIVPYIINDLTLNDAERIALSVLDVVELSTDETSGDGGESHQRIQQASHISANSASSSHAIVHVFFSPVIMNSYK